MSQSALRGIEVLAYLAESDESLTVAQIATGTEISRATVYRVVEELQNDGWIEACGPGNRLRLSLRVAQLGIAALRQRPVRDVLVTNGIGLARTTGRMATVAFYERGEVVFTDYIEVLGDRIMPRNVGMRAPAAATGSGKILLAHQEPVEIARVAALGLPPLTANTKTTPEEIQADISLTQAHGYGYAYDELATAMGGLAVAVFDSSGRAVGALGVHAHEPPSQSLTEQLLAPARLIATRASLELGYRSERRAVV